MAERKWFKMYVGWSDSEWLRGTPPAPRLCWPLLIEWVKTQGTGGTADMGRDGKLADFYDVPKAWIEELLSNGKKGGGVRIEKQKLTIINWREYQGDPTGAERQQRHRQVQKQPKNSNGSNALRNDRNSYVTGVTAVTTEKEKEKEKEKEREKEIVQNRRILPVQTEPPEVFQKVVANLSQGSGTNGSLLKPLAPPDTGPDEESKAAVERIRQQLAASRAAGEIE